MIVSRYTLLLGLLIALVVGLPAVGLAGLLQFLFPLLGLGIGVFALWTSPTRHYIQFVMLLWMFAPLVRRLVDWQIGRTDLSPVLITPLLVTLLSFLVLPNRWPKNQAAILYSLLLYLVVVFWGALMGIISGNIIAAVYALTTWIAPVGLGLMVLSRSDRVDEISDALTNAVVYGSAVMAIYGMIQFMVIPPWDKAWITATGVASMGQAVAGQMRVFSTMNAAGIFAVVLMVALLAIFNRPSFKFLLAGIPILLTLGLTLVRGAWGGFALGLLVLVLLGRARVKLRVLLIGGAFLVVGIPLFVQSSFFDTVTDRANSLWSLESDNSFEARTSFVSTILSDIPSLAMGHGLGASGVASGLSEAEGGITSFDNGLLDILFLYGIVGLVMLGIVAFWSWSLIQAARARPAYAASAVIPLVIFAQLILVDTLYAPNSIFLFPFLGIAMAGMNCKKARRIPINPHDRTTSLQSADTAFPGQIATQPTVR